MTKGAEVWLLGAGFSHAVSTHMPMLQELGELVADRIGKDARFNEPANPYSTLGPSRLEEWLSYLSADAPWLTEADRLQNRALFLRLSGIVAELVSERERVARDELMPPWLRSLIQHWDATGATVISLNYDNLVEAAYMQTMAKEAVGEYRHPSQLFKSGLTPIGARRGAVVTADQVATFELLKLHGSRSWYYSGSEHFLGETIYDDTRCEGWSEDRPRDDSWLVSDKVPLLAPPTATKSAFFNNETLRGQWRRAWAALRRSQRVWVAGYSFPQTDLLVSALAQTSIGPSRVINVVDVSAAPCERLKGLLPMASISDAFISSEHPIKAAVASASA